jgi:hypothetical protein
MPVDTWSSRLPKQWRDRGPRVEETPDGPYWFCDGVLAQIVYGPTCTQLRMSDAALHEQVSMVYNDWAAEFQKRDPKRLILLPDLPSYDPIVAKKELLRCAKLGHKGAIVSDTVGRGAPLFEDEWAPFWDAAQETGLPIHVHLSGGTHSVKMKLDSWRQPAFVAGADLARRDARRDDLLGHAREAAAREVRDGRGRRVELIGHARDPARLLRRIGRRQVERGGAEVCPKGTTLGDLHHDPNRLRAPLVRRGDTFHEVTWEEAFAEAERRLRAVIEAHGIGAVTAYIGNPTAHNFSLGRYVAAFVPMSGIERLYSAGTVDQWPKNVSSALLFGGMWTFRIPDLDRTDYLLVMGANPSQGSLLAAADVLGTRRDLRAWRQGGGDRPPLHRHREARRRMGRDSPRHRRCALARGRPGAVRGGPRAARAAGELVDELSGNAIVNGIPVAVGPA